MLGPLRSPRWQMRGAWFRLAGLALLLASFFLPLPPGAVVALLLPGLMLFLFGAVVWLVRTEEPWLRRGR